MIRIYLLLQVAKELSGGWPRLRCQKWLAGAVRRTVHLSQFHFCSFGSSRSFIGGLKPTLGPLLASDALNILLLYLPN